MVIHLMPLFKKLELRSNDIQYDGTYTLTYYII